MCIRDSAEDDGKDAEKTTSKSAKDTENDDDRTIGKAIKNDVNVRSKPTKKGCLLYTSRCV